MNEKYLQIFQDGMGAQLQELTLDEMVDYFRNHIHNFLLDPKLSFLFIERFANDPELKDNQRAQNILMYVLDKALQLRPFRPGLLQAVLNLTGNRQVKERIDIIEKLIESRDLYDQIIGLDIKHEHTEIQEFIGKLIEVHPRHLAAAQFALRVDHYLGQKPGPWLGMFKCPSFLKDEWDIHIFNHYASLAFFDEAAALWPTLNQSLIRETALNNAAEMFVAKGEIQKGIQCYEASLTQDGRQTPVKLRLRQLKEPFTPDPSLPGKCTVEICVYSWNKDEVLAQTLRSLSETDIGNARVNILLNGCTDNSRSMVEEVLPLFPDNDVVIHDLHVNIGAPAARNWLMRLPEVRKSDYIAFIDDDILLQKDWLVQFLTVAEADSSVGVVGCKIVNPGQPRLYQYLFRYVALASHGLLKLSIPAMPEQFDNNAYDFVRETRSVMGCQHLLRTSAVEKIPAGFDIRFSPSQVDDMDHDIAVCLEGYKVMYCGTVTCQHLQGSGVALVQAQEWNPHRTGNALGNDLKFYFKHFDHMEKLQALDNLSIDLGVDLPDF